MIAVAAVVVKTLTMKRQTVPVDATRWRQLRRFRTTASATLRQRNGQSAWKGCQQHCRSHCYSIDRNDYVTVFSGNLPAIDSI